MPKRKVATPRPKPPPKPDPVRKYRVKSHNCVWGARGDIIERAFPAKLELSLFQSGTLELVIEVREFSPKKTDRPVKSADGKVD